MIQETKVIAHLKTKASISTREAVFCYNILSLTKIMSELRRKGYRILSVNKIDKVRRTPYKQYYVLDREDFAPVKDTVNA
tara:strand:+ start:427 stop:666 length:240 start_codon:yes stop_codon:yes gene_type:complete